MDYFGTLHAVVWFFFSFLSCMTVNLSMSATYVIFFKVVVLCL
uniref:Uncharacterized protein n=1 Tax=Anguilla anguilla TaxID=7936 RepID=A0A0E9S587_ANGAN